MDGFRAWLAEGRIEPGLARMTALSAVLHLVAAALLFAFGSLGVSKEPKEIAYTVKIVDPASLGGRLPKAASPEKGPEKPAPPKEPAPPPEPEPEDEAVAIPEKKEKKPEPTKRPEKEAKKPEPKPTPAPTKKPAPTRKPAPTKKPEPKPSKSSGPSEEEVGRQKRDRKIQEAIERLQRGGEAANDDAPIGSGGQGRGGGTLTGLDFIMYKNRVEGTIRQNWAWVGSNPDLTVRVRFQIEPDGTARNVRLVSPSGDRTFDDSVIRAIHASSPFPPPPEQYRDAFSDYVLEFVSGEMSG